MTKSPWRSIRSERSLCRDRLCPEQSCYCRSPRRLLGRTSAIKKVVFQVKIEDSQRVNALTTGDVDYAVIPIKDFDYVGSLGGYNVDLQSSAAVECAFFNLSPDGVLGTLEARLAVMHAIDRQALVDMVYGGMVATPSWPVSDAAYGYEPAFGNLEVYAHGYDVEKARA